MSSSRISSNQAPRATWSTWSEATALIAFGPNLRRTVSVALLVGTIFFSMNQLPAVAAGQLTLALVLKGVLTYLVPLCVSNYGILAASRARGVVVRTDKEDSDAGN